MNNKHIYASIDNDLELKKTWSKLNIYDIIVYVWLVEYFQGTINYSNGIPLSQQNYSAHPMTWLNTVAVTRKAGDNFWGVKVVPED